MKIRREQAYHIEGTRPMERTDGCLAYLLPGFIRNRINVMVLASGSTKPFVETNEHGVNISGGYTLERAQQTVAEWEREQEESGKRRLTYHIIKNV